METQFDPISEVCGRIEFARTLFLKDLGAMTNESLSATCGGASRCGFDLTFELSGMYGTFADLLTNTGGEIQGPKGWVRAPEEFKDKEAATQTFDASLSKFTSAIKAYGGNPLQDQFQSPVGPFTALGMANLAVWHTMYHSGQLNYIQTVHGDTDFHWS